MRALLACLAVPLAAAAQPASTAPPSPDGAVSTSATAHETVANTLVLVGMGIETHGRDVAAAVDPLNKAARGLIDHLKSAGAQKLGTGDLRLTPDTESVRGQPDRITGYTAAEQVSFQTTPDAFPALIAGALQNGANTIGEVSVVPSEADLTAGRRAAVLAATRSAIEEARAVAHAAGAHAVGMPEITVVGQPSPIPLGPRVMRAAMAAPAPAIEAGSSELAVSVTVRMRMEPGEQ